MKKDRLYFRKVKKGIIFGYRMKNRIVWSSGKTFSEWKKKGLILWKLRCQVCGNSKEGFCVFEDFETKLGKIIEDKWVATFCSDECRKIYKLTE